MSVAGLDDSDSERCSVAGELHDAKLRSSTFAGKQKLKIADEFRGTVLKRACFSVFRRHYLKNTACYRLGWNLSRKLQSLLSPCLRSIANSSVHTSPAVSSRSLDSPRSSSPGRSRAVQRVRKTTKLITQLVVGKKVIDRLTLLQVRRAFHRLSVNNSPQSEPEPLVPESTKDSFRKQRKQAIVEPVREEVPHSDGIQLKSEQLANRISTIVQLLESRKRQSEERSQAEGSDTVTPKRSLNLRIPNPSSASTSPFSSDSAVDRTPTRQALFSLDRATSRPSDTLSADLERIQVSEQLLRIWKGWKGYIAQCRVRKLKVGMARRNRETCATRKVFAAIGLWVEYCRGKKRWSALARLHYQRTVKKRLFGALSITHSSFQRIASIQQKKNFRIAKYIIARWRTFGRIHSLRRHKVSTMSSLISIRLKYKYTAVWQLAAKLLKVDREKSEKALFCWYSRAMPKAWKRVKKGVEIAKIKRKMRAIALKLRRKLLLAHIVPLWRDTVVHVRKVKLREREVCSQNDGKRAKSALLRLQSFTAVRREVVANSEKADCFARRWAMLRCFKLMKSSIQAIQLLGDRHCALFSSYSNRLKVISFAAWKKWSKQRLFRKRKASQLLLQVDSSRTATAFRSWHSALQSLLQSTNTAEQFYSERRKKVVFTAIKQHSDGRIRKWQKLQHSISAVKDSIIMRIFVSWKKRIVTMKNHRRDSATATCHYMKRLYSTWRTRFLQNSAIKKLVKTRLIRNDWDLWKQYVEDMKMENYGEKLAHTHLYKGTVRKAWKRWISYHQNMKRYREISVFLIDKTKKRKRNDVFSAWKTAKPLLTKAKKRDKLASDLLTVHFRRLLTLIITKLRVTTKKVSQLRKKCDQFRYEKAFVQFENAIQTTKMNGRNHRLMMKKAIKHLEKQRLMKGFSVLLQRLDRRNRLLSISVGAARSSIISGLQRWKEYHNRYLSLLRKAKNHREAIENSEKKAAIKRLLQYTGERRSVKRLNQRVEFYWDRKVGRVLLAWKRVAENKAQIRAREYGLYDVILVKVYFQRLVQNATEQQTLTEKMNSLASAHEKVLKMRCFRMLLRNRRLQEVARNVLATYPAQLKRAVLQGWSVYVKSHLAQKRILSERFSNWESRKQLQIVMDYVQPRLRRNTGLKLNAWFRWKRATAGGCKVLAFMKLLLPRDQASAVKTERIVTKVFDRWRSVSLYQRLYSSTKAAFFQRRCLIRRGFRSLCNGAKLSQLRRKKTRTALLFSRLKQKAQVFLSWKALPRKEGKNVDNRKVVKER